MLIFANYLFFCLLPEFLEISKAYIVLIKKKEYLQQHMFLILYQFNHFCQYNCCLFQDVHERFRTESHSESASRFNERFLLSIASCKACVVMDDELNVLPISSHIRSITPVSVAEASFVFHSFSVFVCLIFAVVPYTYKLQ